MPARSISKTESRSSWSLSPPEKPLPPKRPPIAPPSAHQLTAGNLPTQALQAPGKDKIG